MTPESKQVQKYIEEAKELLNIEYGIGRHLLNPFDVKDIIDIAKMIQTEHLHKPLQGKQKKGGKHG